jgi:hypothetical protein
MNSILTTLFLTLFYLNIPLPIIAQSCNLSTAVGTGATVSTPCTITNGTIDGVDDGSNNSTSPNSAALVVNSSLTIGTGSTLITGKLILGSGSVAINGSILFGTPLWRKDEDGDGFPDLGASAIASPNQPANYVRKGGISESVTDANDSVSCPNSSCFANCQKCQNGGASNVSAGLACSAGSEVAITTSVYCGTTAVTVGITSAANAVSALQVNSSFYRSCNGSGACYADNTSAVATTASSTIYASLGNVFTNTSGTTATANSTNNCSIGSTTTLGACSGKTVYYGSDGSGNCSGVGSSVAINAANAKVYSNSVGATIAAGVGYSCGIGTGSTLTSVGGGCSATSTNISYFRACNGSGACRADNTGAGTSQSNTYANVTDGYIHTNTTGTTAVPNLSANCGTGYNCTANTCSRTLKYKSCNGSGACRADLTNAATGSTEIVTNFNIYDAGCNLTGGTCTPVGTGCTTYWANADGDSYGIGSSARNYCGIGSTTSWIIGGGTADCCDSVGVGASIFPGSTTFYSTSHPSCVGVSGWDYDCDGQATFQTLYNYDYIYDSTTGCTFWNTSCISARGSACRSLAYSDCGATSKYPCQGPDIDATYGECKARTSLFRKCPTTCTAVTTQKNCSTNASDTIECR